MWVRQWNSSAVDDSVSDGDGGYLASASDLMIGLLFVFIILVVVLALEQRRQQQAFDERTRRLTGAGDPLVAVTGAIGNALRDVNANVQINPKTGVITLPEDVLFQRGQAQLTDAGRQVLANAADKLATSMPCYVDNQRAGRECKSNPYGHEVETIFIEGHTDSVPFAGNGRDNFTLSLERARAVNEILVSNVVLSSFRNKAQQPLFSFSAYADTRPIFGADPTDGRNRRVDLRIVLSYKPIGELIPEIRGLPAGDGRQ